MSSSRKQVGSPPRTPHWRQGDVFIITAAEADIPADAAVQRPVLAEGEVTGHSHRLEDPLAGQVLRSRSGGLFLKITDGPAQVIHDEHGPITLPAGQYRIRIQREYHPKEIRQVID